MMSIYCRNCLKNLSLTATMSSRLVLGRMQIQLDETDEETTALRRQLDEERNKETELRKQLVDAIEDIKKLRMERDSANARGESARTIGTADRSGGNFFFELFLVHVK